MNKSNRETKPKEETETMYVPLDLKPSAQDYTITSVLDELEGFLDSIGQADTQPTESDFTEGDISSSQDENRTDKGVKVKDISRPSDCISCSDCDFKTNSDRILRLHTNYQHGTNLDVTEVSQKIIARKQTYKRKNTRGGVQKICTLCNFETNGHSKLLMHYQEAHKGETIFKCDDCYYGSNWSVNLQNHKDSIHNNKIYPCDLCD